MSFRHSASEELTHPSTLLEAETVALLRAHAPEAEAARRLHDRQLAVMRERKWFKLFVPPEWGAGPDPAASA